MAPDFTYSFQVTAFTNDSDTTKTSDIVTHTVGPPLNAKNVDINMKGFPDEPVVLTWSTGSSGSDITLYIVELYEKAGSMWNKTNITTINGT